jgi:hypothetical protein
MGPLNERHPRPSSVKEAEIGLYDGLWGLWKSLRSNNLELSAPNIIERKDVAEVARIYTAA